MCQTLIEKYVCGDKESSTFPCENFFDTGTCDSPEEDKIINHKDKKCPECKHFDEAMQRIAEDVSLAPEPKRGGVEVADPNAPKKFYKEYIKWSKCGRKLFLPPLRSNFQQHPQKHLLTTRPTDLSHPKWTDIERFDDGPEIGFEIEGIGRCHGCAEANPRTLARMERDGVLHTADPWGFMEAEPDAAAGSSAAATGEQISNQAIAMGITDAALADLHGAPAAWDRRSALPPLPGYASTMGNSARGASGSGSGGGGGGGGGAHHASSWSRSPSPGFHAGAATAKGKGRHGHDDDTYASRYGGADSPSYDEGDDRSIYSSSGSPPRGRSNAPPASHRPRFPARASHSGSGSNSNSNSASSSESDYNNDDEAPGSRVPQSWGSAPPNNNNNPRNRARNANAPPHAAGGPGDTAAFVAISAAERRRLGIPGGMQLTAEGLGRFEQRRGEEGRLAMRQDKEGVVRE